MRKNREIPSFAYSPDCVLYLPLWKRDGSTFISDDKYGHLCTVTGATWGIQGRTFASGNRITMPSVDALNPTNLTLVCYFKTTAVTGALVEKWAAVAATYPYTMKFDGAGKLLFGCYDGTNEPLAVSTNALNDNAWHCAVGIRDIAADNLRLYIDDVLDDTETDTTTIAVANTDVLSIGARGNGGIPFVGTEGEVILFNRVFSVSEVLNLRQKIKWRYV